MKPPRWLLRRLERWFARRGFWVQVYSLPDNTPDEASYVGDLVTASYLAARGIRPEKRALDHSVATIGYCEREHRWYGWSHRAICGFGVGDSVDSEDHLCAEELPIGFIAHTINDARRMACAMAESVS